MCSKSPNHASRKLNILMLPDDILEDIFLLCLPEAHLESTSYPTWEPSWTMAPDKQNSFLYWHSPSVRGPKAQDGYTITKAPFNIASVCRSLRALALSFPRLWSCIIVGARVAEAYFQASDSRKKEKRNVPLLKRIVAAARNKLSQKSSGRFEAEQSEPDFIKQCLLRSGSCPLRIALTLLPGNFEATYRSLLHTTDRWVSLDIRAHHRHCADDVKYLLHVAEKSESLSSLTIRFDWTPRPHGHLIPGATKLSIPALSQLHDITIHGTTPGFSCPTFDSPRVDFKVLRYLALSKPTTYADALSWLKMCPNLEGAFFIIGKFAAHTSAQNLVDLPRLRFLELCTENDLFEGPGLILDHLHVPNLLSLIVDSRKPGGDWEHVLSLIRRSYPPLTKLMLEGYPTTWTFTAELLKECNDLLYLGLGGTTYSDDLAKERMGRGTTNAPPATYFPHLKTLDIWTSSGSPSILASFISSIRNIGEPSESPLKAVWLKVPFYKHDEFEKAVSRQEVIVKCREGGLHFAVIFE